MSKQLKPIDELKNSIQAMGPQFKAALPNHINVEKFSRVLMTAVSTTPALVEATRVSLFGACMKLAQSGLLPDGKEAAIVTFRNKQGDNVAQAMPMVSGILKLVRNSGELASITANVVYQNDVFDYFIDEDGDHLSHRPNLDGDRGQMKLVYAIAKTKDGAVYSEVMSKTDVDKIRNSSRSKDVGPWVTWYDEMAKKTVIRRLSKRLPMSTDIEDVIKAEDDNYEPIPDRIVQEIVESQPDKKTKSSKLAEVIEAQAEPPVKKIKNYAPGAEDMPPSPGEGESPL